MQFLCRCKNVCSYSFSGFFYVARAANAVITEAIRTRLEDQCSPISLEPEPGKLPLKHLKRKIKQELLVFLAAFWQGFQTGCF